MYLIHREGFGKSEDYAKVPINTANLGKSEDYAKVPINNRIGTKILSVPGKTYSRVRFSDGKIGVRDSPKYFNQADDIDHKTDLVTVLSGDNYLQFETVVHSAAVQLNKFETSSRKAWESLGGPVMIGLLNEQRHPYLITALVLIVGELENRRTKNGEVRFDLLPDERDAICDAVFTYEFSSYIEMDIRGIYQSRSTVEYVDKIDIMEKNPLAYVSRVCDLDDFPETVPGSIAYNLKRRSLLDRIGRDIARRSLDNRMVYELPPFNQLLEDDGDIVAELDAIASVPVNDWLPRGVGIRDNSYAEIFIEKLMKKLLIPSNAFFLPHMVMKRYVLLSPKSSETDMLKLGKIVKDRYIAIGYLIGLSLIYDVPLGIEFADDFYRLLIDGNVTLWGILSNVDLRSLSSKTLFQNIKNFVKDSGNFHRLSGNFAPNGRSSDYLTSLDGLRSFSISNRFDDNITPENVMTWSEMAVNDYMNTVYGICMEYILMGFYKMVPRTLFHDFGKYLVTVDDLRNMLRGDNDIPFGLLWEIMQFPSYGLYSDGTEEQAHLREILETGSNSFRRYFLFFATGIRSLPFNGIIIKVGESFDSRFRTGIDSWPMSIRMPKYQDLATLRENLIQAFARQNASRRSRP